jgi:diaminopimelate decarboxylase
MGVLELFPDSGAVVGGELVVGGLSASELAREHGTPLVVYCEQTMRARARAYRSAAPDAVTLYGSKAFPNVAVLSLLVSEGLGADVSTLGELELALRAGVPAGSIVLHGNNKSEEELRRAAEVDAWLVVLDALDEVERAAWAGVRRVLVRVTPGIDPDTHDAIKTGHRGSKFGLPPEQALHAIAHARDEGLDVQGLHVHLGSQLLDAAPARFSVDWLAGFAAECRSELDWTPAVVDVGGGLGIRYVETERAPSIDGFVEAIVERVGRAWALHGLPAPRLVFEPGRSVVGEAGVTLYTVGSVKQASEQTAYVAVDGGMSDNPRPQLYERGSRACSRTAWTIRSRASTRFAGSTASRETCSWSEFRFPGRSAATLLPSPRPVRTRWRWRQTTTRCRGRRPCSSRTVRRG